MLPFPIAHSPRSSCIYFKCYESLDIVDLYQFYIVRYCLLFYEFLPSPQGVTTQKTNIDIFTTVITSDIILYEYDVGQCALSWYSELKDCIGLYDVSGVGSNTVFRWSVVITLNRFVTSFLFWYLHTRMGFNPRPLEFHASTLISATCWNEVRFFC
jgi:hypothetical protein